MMQHNSTSPCHPSEWTEDALRAALAADDLEPAEFDLPAMLTRLIHDDVSWFDLVHDHHVARRTTVPCPDWCELPQFHLFSAFDEPGQPHSREHVIDLTPTGVKPAEDYLETITVKVLVPELREGDDDTTALMTKPQLWVNVEGSFAAEDMAKLGAALVVASNKMRELAQ